MCVRATCIVDRVQQGASKCHEKGSAVWMKPIIRLSWLYWQTEDVEYDELTIGRALSNGQ